MGCCVASQFARRRLPLQAMLGVVCALSALVAVQTAPAAIGQDLLHTANARVYVADLPPKYNLHTIAKEGCEEGQFLKDLLANPLGSMFDGSLDLALYRDPFYYSLEVHMHLQMLYSPLRVLSPEEADVVYVPFYGTQLVTELGGEGACKPNWTEAAQDALIADFWADAPALMPLLGAKPHWMQLSEIEWMIHRGCGEGWGIPLACHPLAEHITFATPEAMTEMHPQWWRQRMWGARRPENNNSISIPYLGHIHRVSMHNRAKLLQDEAVASKKQHLATMSFGSMRYAWLRMNLTEQCQAVPSECWYMHYSGFLDVIESYRKSWFCVQPFGDSPTRSALMDCMASGLAVPCVFDDYLFDMLPFADVINYRSMMVNIDPDEVQAPGVSFLDSLRTVNDDARAAMLKSVQAVSHALQYAVQPNHLLVRYDSLSVIHPMDDAFTMSFKAVLRHACKGGHRHCRKVKSGARSLGRRSSAGAGALGGEP